MDNESNILKEKVARYRRLHEAKMPREQELTELLDAADRLADALGAPIEARDIVDLEFLAVDFDDSTITFSAPQDEMEKREWRPGTASVNLSNISRIRA